MGKDPYQKLTNTSGKILYIACNEPSCELFVTQTEVGPGESTMRHEACFKCGQLKITNDERCLVDIPQFLQTKAPAILGKSPKVFDAMLFWTGFISGAMFMLGWCIGIIYFAPQTVIHSLPMLGY